MRAGLLILAWAAPLISAAEPNGPTSKKDVSAFGVLRSTDAVTARNLARDWLRSAGKDDPDTLKHFETIWSANERSVLDRVADTLALGDPTAARILAEARADRAPAPTRPPAELKDASLSAFYRANLAVAYARGLTKRRVFEEALEALRSVRPEHVADPAAYLFHKAVAEHALMLKDDASRTIARLLDETLDAPERYKMVAALMLLDMQSWRQKDLGEISRKMDNVERRLELARGGPHTQKLQKEILLGLDELIKKLENQAKGSSQPNAGGCPNGGNPQGQQGGQPGPNPQLDSFGGNNSGPGKVDQKKLDTLVKQWGKLPEKERAKAMQEMTRDLPPEYRELIEAYFRKLAQSEGNKP